MSSRSMHSRDEDDGWTSAEEIDDYEEDVMFSGRPSSSGGGFGQLIELFKRFFPTGWPGKTIVQDRTEVVHKTKVRQMNEAFPVMREDRVGWISEGVDLLDEYASSQEGQSREELTNIIRAGFGDDAGEVETGGLKEWLKNDMSKNDE